MPGKVLDDAPHVPMEKSLITFAGSCFHFVLLCLTCFIGFIICPIDSKNLKTFSRVAMLRSK